jgi:hypothetical protein
VRHDADISDVVEWDETRHFFKELLSKRAIRAAT